MQKSGPASGLFPTLVLLALGGALAGIFHFLGRQPELDAHIPEFIAAALAAGALYLAGVYVVERFRVGLPALLIILLAALAMRAFVLPSPPSLSGDGYRYQWEGKAQRAGFNPYTSYPLKPGLESLQDPNRPLSAGGTTPTLYPPLSEWSFSWVVTLAGYKRLYTGFDVASVGVLLVLLAACGLPLSRVLVYAWNPTVVVSFAMCGHHDSLAILPLLVANALIVGRQKALSVAFLAASFLSKFFAGLLLPAFLKRTRWKYAGVFLAVVAVGYLPFASAGLTLLEGLAHYAAGWENNDSLFRLLRLVGNSRPQAYLVAGVMLLGLIAYTLKRRLEPLRAGLFLLAGLLLLSPNAFPWYFTWTVPFLCFYPSAPWLLMTVTCVLGYAPAIPYAAGQPYVDSPVILMLEYVPVFAWLLYAAWRAAKQESARGSEAGGLEFKISNSQLQKRHDLVSGRIPRPHSD